MARADDYPFYVGWFGGTEEMDTAAGKVEGGTEETSTTAGKARVSPTWRTGRVCTGRLVNDAPCRLGTWANWQQRFNNEQPAR